MQSRAATVAEYLAELPDDRRAIVESVRQVILASKDSQIEEGMQYGMIGYFVPHTVYPQGYHCDPRQPLPYMALASQKNHCSLYMMFCYGAGDSEQWLRNAFRQAGKKLDMGKACIRFQKLDDLPLEVLAEAIRRIPAAAHIARYESVFAASQRPKSAGKGTKRPRATEPKNATKPRKTAPPVQVANTKTAAEPKPAARTPRAADTKQAAKTKQAAEPKPAAQTPRAAKIKQAVQSKRAAKKRSDVRSKPNTIP